MTEAKVVHFAQAEVENKREEEKKEGEETETAELLDIKIPIKEELKE